MRYWDGDTNSDSDDHCYDHFTELRAIRRKDRQRDWKERVAEYFVKLKEEEQRKILRGQEESESDEELADTAPATLPRKRKAKETRRHRSEYYKLMFMDGRDTHEEWLVHRYKQRRIGKDFHGFMHLPLAIRYMIYEHALVRGKIFIRNTLFNAGRFEHWAARYSFKDFSGKNRQRYLDVDEHRTEGVQAIGWPQLTRPIHPITKGLLLGVCKAVQTEAEYVFWGIGNTFVFPAGEFDGPEGFYSGGSVIGLKPAKSVSYTFDMRDVGYIDPYHLRKAAERDQEDYELFEDMNAELQREALHEIQLDALEDVWRGRCETIRRLPLQKLQIDVEECYCPVGCCRLVETVFAMLGPFQEHAPSKIEVLGWKNKAEKDVIRKWMVDGGEMK
jgi:hypothetical protein